FGPSLHRATFQPEESNLARPDASVAAPWVAANGALDFRSGSFSTDSARRVGWLMSASLQKQRNYCAAAICRDGPRTDSCTAANSIAIQSVRRRGRRAAWEVSADRRAKSWHCGGTHPRLRQRRV